MLRSMLLYITFILKFSCYMKSAHFFLPVLFFIFCASYSFAAFPVSHNGQNSISAKNAVKNKKHFFASGHKSSTAVKIHSLLRPFSKFLPYGNDDTDGTLSLVFGII